jgi:prepilin-type N-terminal cleavage/methylation domain-containing protein
MTRRGFSLIELLLVIVIIGLVGLIATPRLRTSLERSKVRAVRSSLANYVSKARATAVARGCQATLNVTGGAAGTVWITACLTTTVGAGGGTETVGQRDSIAANNKVTITTDVASLVFDRRGIRTDRALSTIVVQSNTSTLKDSIQINQVGRVIQR